MIARFPENIHEIHEIHEIHWMPRMRGFPCAQRCERKAHLVTICHRPWEWPFFRVFEGKRRIDGFPFGWSRNPPKKGRFGALSDGASNRPARRTRKVILRVEIPGSDVKRIRPGITSPA